ncbi:MAG: hypothetical protein SWX82_18975 [Cyanobacteriota bacterium]|nr:hypothetical protein [Cyanobacteriota bacterium]
MFEPKKIFEVSILVFDNALVFTIWDYPDTPSDCDKLFRFYFSACIWPDLDPVRVFKLIILGFQPDRQLCTSLCRVYPFLISILPELWYDADALDIEGGDSVSY